MNLRVVLDATAFDVLDSPAGADLRGLLRRTAARDGEVCCAAVTLAEVCRGRARTRRAESAIARVHGGCRIRVVPTDERLAKLVGAILFDSAAGSEMIASSHCARVPIQPR